MTDINELVTSVEDFQKDAKKTIEELRSKNAALSDRIVDLEQRTFDGYTPASYNRAPKTLADQIVKDDAVSAVATKKSQRTAIEVKASDLLETKSTTTTATQPTTVSAGMMGNPMRNRFLRELFPTATVGSGALEWSKETSANPTAGNQSAEGAAKDEATITFSLETSTLPTVEHYTKVSRQAMSDAGLLMPFLDMKLRHGLNLKVDANIVSALTNSGDFTAFTPVSGGNQIVNVRHAIGLLEELDANPTHILLNPADARDMDLLTDNEGNYILGGSAMLGGDTQNVWSVKVFKSNAVTQGKLLVVDPMQAGVFFSREEATIQIGYENDDFTKNIVTLLAEMRGNLIVGTAKATAYGDLSS